MKRLKIMVLCTLTVTLSSCLDMLNKTPISQLSVDKLFETVDGAEAAVAGCYSFLYGTGYYSQDRWCFAFEGTDISSSAGGSANYQWTSGENRWSDWWLTTYQAIGACNTAISRIKESTFDENKRILLLSEARCLRAFYYYHALTYWGGVPLLQDEITSLDQVKNVNRATKDELAKFIIDELEEVSPLLEKNPAVVARISKGASYTLLAKMYLLQKQWEKAAGACEEVMGLNKYKLFDNYSDIFSQAFENEQEHIFSIQFNADYTDFSARMLWYLGPSKEEWDKFNGLGGSSAPTSFYNKYDEWDLRLEHNLAKTWRGQPFKDSRIAVIKYWDRTGKQMLDHDGLNFPVFRYADVLLMYAEALN